MFHGLKFLQIEKLAFEKAEESFAFDCTGTVGGELLNAAASLGGEFAFTYEPFSLPERVTGEASE